MSTNAARTFSVGEIMTRADLSVGRGGNWQNGIVTSERTGEVFAFSDPKKAQKSGYHWDGWSGPEQQIYYYTREGQHGDQEFTIGNKNLRYAGRDGRTIHLFLAAGKKKNTATIEHRYLVARLRTA